MKVLSVKNYACESSNSISKGQSSIKMTPADSVHFKGGFSNFVNGRFKSLETAGFFMQFLIVDTISMVAPRAWVGFNRDKDKTGKYNIQAGLEEFGREALSGPTMNLIPMACMAFTLHKVLPTIKLDKETMQGTNNSFMDAIKENETGLTKENVVKRLAGQIYDDTFKANKEHAEYDKLRSSFVSTLSQASDNKMRTFIERHRNIETPYSKAEEKFNKLVIEINNKFCGGIAPDDAHRIQLNGIVDKNGKPISTDSQTYFEDFHRYSKDVIEKFMKKDASQSIKDFLKERISKTNLGRNVLAVAAFLAVGGFLLYLPKVYQCGKVSPAQQSAQRAQGGANENK